MNRRLRRRVVWSLSLGCLALVLCVAPGLAQAGIVEWDFRAEAGLFDFPGEVKVEAPNTEDLNTFASPTVPAGPATYKWTVDIIQVYARVLNQGFNIWLGTGETIFETGQHDGSLPFTLIGIDFVEPNVISARIDMYVDADGKGHLDLKNVQFGSFGGAPLTGIGLSGTISVDTTPVPEPSTALLFLGGVAPLGWIAYRRRRR
ncbi:MAG: PEP-CTERM sorting domain-containing protein [Pirellulaceae bacterium]|jgi:hypothetical protein|nr:PEP-CTERM sorting domain-containing protein [Pirellulaceae bacterium]